MFQCFVDKRGTERMVLQDILVCDMGFQESCCRSRISFSQ